MMKTLGLLTACLMLIVPLYLGVALVTARIPASGPSVLPSGTGKSHTIYLVTGLLHADIAVPVSEQLLTRFPMLGNTSLPFDNPDMEYVLFGWGSKAFYTTAGSYSDIRLSAVFKAVTGDQSVMRVTASGALQDEEDVVALHLDDQQMEALYNGIAQGFSLNGGEAVRIKGASIGPFDAFFEGNGRFNIFYPCNQWVNDVLQQAGIRLGIWTPITYSLKQSLAYFGQS